MTPTSALLAASGLSHREAASLFSVSVPTVNSWSCGRNQTPPHVIEKLTQIVRDNLSNASQIASGKPAAGFSAIVIGLSLAMKI
jgi:hypothetical protein